jgi:hypothetical protein
MYKLQLNDIYMYGNQKRVPCFVIVLMLFMSSFLLLVINPSLLYTPQLAIAQILNRTQTSVTTATSSNFLTYVNPTLGLTMQYPSNWLIRERPYNPAGNSTIVSLFAPPESAFATTGSISAVSGAFIPYMDVFVFNSKNMSLNELINKTVKNIANASITQSKPINSQAYMLEYTVTMPGGNIFKRMQDWTISGGKVFVITYTSLPPSYSKYLPTVQKIIESIQIVSPASPLNGAPITKNQEQQQEQQQRQLQPATENVTNDETTSRNSAIGIPGLP